MNENGKKIKVLLINEYIAPTLIVQGLFCVFFSGPSG